MEERVGSAPVLYLSFRGSRVIVREGENGLDFPRPEALERFGHRVDAVEGVEAPDGRLACRAMSLEGPEEPPPGFAAYGLRQLYGRVPEHLFGLLSRASQLLEWNRSHRFCGRCGEPTRSSQNELAKTCTRCGARHFPRLNPAIIVSVRRDDEILLGRAPHFQPGVYSVLAGFVEPGESLEETVVREVREGVGIEVDGKEFFGILPWPLPKSLYITFNSYLLDYSLDILLSVMNHERY